MDIQVSSNFERLLFELTRRDAPRVSGFMDALARDGRFEMAEDEVALMSALFDAARVDEAQTQETMRDVLKRFDMQIDPHTAVGLAAARRAVLPDGVPMVTLATAHPAKFPAAAEAAFGTGTDIPARVREMMAQPERISPVENAWARFRLSSVKTTDGIDGAQPHKFSETPFARGAQSTCGQSGQFAPAAHARLSPLGETAP